MSRFTVFAEITVEAEDLSHACEIIESEVFPIAGWDNQIIGISYNEDEITIHDKEDN